MLPPELEYLLPRPFAPPEPEEEEDERTPFEMLLQALGMSPDSGVLGLAMGLQRGSTAATGGSGGAPAPPAQPMPMPQGPPTGRGSYPVPQGGRSPLRAFPVVKGASYSDDFGAPRGGGTRTHQGNDIFAPEGTPIVASYRGQLDYGTDSLGGLIYTLDNPNKGHIYGAHMSGYGPTPEGRVQAGDVVGYVGDTGNAQGTSPHLHFQYNPSFDPYGDYVSPYPFLKMAENASRVRTSMTPTSAAGRRPRRMPQPSLTMQSSVAQDLLKGMS